MTQKILAIQGIVSQENKEHPKTQHTRKRRNLTVPKICVFRCVVFSGALFRGFQKGFLLFSEVSKGGFCDSRGREISIIGVVRRIQLGAPAQEKKNGINYCNRCAQDPNSIC